MGRSRISYGLKSRVSFAKGRKGREELAYLSLNAFITRSTYNSQLLSGIVKIIKLTSSRLASSRLILILNEMKVEEADDEELMEEHCADGLERESVATQIALAPILNLL